MYGLSRTNIRRPSGEHGSSTVLRSKGIGAVDQFNGSYLVAGTILWWPKQGILETRRRRIRLRARRAGEGRSAGGGRWGGQ